MSASSQVKTVIDQFLSDVHEDLQSSVMAACVDEASRGANQIIALVIDTNGQKKWLKLFLLIR